MYEKRGNTVTLRRTATAWQMGLFGMLLYVRRTKTIKWKENEGEIAQTYDNKVVLVEMERQEDAVGASELH